MDKILQISGKFISKKNCEIMCHTLKYRISENEKNQENLPVRKSGNPEYMCE